jgi:hypothetical protein
VLFCRVEDDSVIRQRHRGNADGDAFAAPSALLSGQREHRCNDQRDYEADARHGVSID